MRRRKYQVEHDTGKPELASKRSATSRRHIGMPNANFCHQKVPNTLVFVVRPKKPKNWQADHLRISSGTVEACLLVHLRVSPPV